MASAKSLAQLCILREVWEGSTPGEPARMVRLTEVRNCRIGIGHAARCGRSCNRASQPEGRWFPQLLEDWLSQGRGDANSLGGLGGREAAAKIAIGALCATRSVKRSSTPSRESWPPTSSGKLGGRRPAQRVLRGGAMSALASLCPTEAAMSPKSPTANDTFVVATNGRLDLLPRGIASEAPSARPTSHPHDECSDLPRSRRLPSSYSFVFGRGSQREPVPILTPPNVQT